MRGDEIWNHDAAAYPHVIARNSVTKQSMQAGLLSPMDCRGAYGSSQ